jgi:uncharacterized protein (DUF2252 family)
MTILVDRRNLKMARSSQAYVRGSAAKFYERLRVTTARMLEQIIDGYDGALSKGRRGSRPV